MKDYIGKGLPLLMLSYRWAGNSFGNFPSIISKEGKHGLSDSSGNMQRISRLDVENRVVLTIVNHVLARTLIARSKQLQVRREKLVNLEVADATPQSLVSSKLFRWFCE